MHSNGTDRCAERRLSYRSIVRMQEQGDKDEEGSEHVEKPSPS